MCLLYLDSPHRLSGGKGVWRSPMALTPATPWKQSLPPPVRSLKVLPWHAEWREHWPETSAVPADLYWITHSWKAQFPSPGSSFRSYDSTAQGVRKRQTCSLTSVPSSIYSCDFVLITDWLSPVHFKDQTEYLMCDLISHPMWFSHFFTQRHIISMTPGTSERDFVLRRGSM